MLDGRFTTGIANILLLANIYNEKRKETHDFNICKIEKINRAVNEGTVNEGRRKQH